MPQVKTLDEIEHPRLTDEQIVFFQNLIEIIKEEMCNFEDVDDPIFKYAYVSLQAQLRQYRWLIDSNDAIKIAERRARLEGRSFSQTVRLNEIEVDSQDSLDVENAIHLL